MSSKTPTITTLVVKLASIAVYAEEFLSANGHPLDKVTLEGLLRDPEVRAWLDDPENAALLPVKRASPAKGKKGVVELLWREDRNLLKRIDQYGKGVSEREAAILNDLLRWVETKPLTSAQRALAQSIEERRVR